MIKNDIESKYYNFIKRNLNNNFSIDSLQGDASSRQYYRIVSNEGKYLLCVDDELKNKSIDKYSYYNVYNLFKNNNINVPELYNIDNENGLLLIEDLGDLLLEKYLLGNTGDGSLIYNIYKKIIDDLVVFQNITDNDSVPFKLSFDSDKLNYEFDFFIENFIKKYLAIDLPGTLEKELKKEFFNISKILDEPEFFVLNHRDFHCRNIIINDSEPYYIDFQDARMGLPQYDLTSLLRDSYFILEDDLFIRLKDYYYEKSLQENVHNFSKIDFEYYFDIMAYQRNIKALGSFGYLIKDKNKSWYEKSIIPTVNYISSYIKNREELKGSYDLLTRLGVF